MVREMVDFVLMVVRDGVCADGACVGGGACARRVGGA